MAARKSKRAQSAKPARKTVANKSQRASAKTRTAKKAVAKKARVTPSRKPTETTALAKKAVAKKAAAKNTVARKSTAKRGVAKKAAAVVSTPKATPARDARSALAQKKAILATLNPAANGKAVVDAYMREVDHPFKAEMAALRQIILAASPKISERIKWNAPSFYYKEDLGAFNPRATEYAHLILLFPGGHGMQDDTGLLEGSHKDRREAKFHSMSDVNAKKPALEKLVKRWVAQRDR